MIPIMVPDAFLNLAEAYLFIGVVLLLVSILFLIELFERFSLASSLEQLDSIVKWT